MLQHPLGWTPAVIDLHENLPENLILWTYLFFWLVPGFRYHLCPALSDYTLCRLHFSLLHRDFLII